MNIISDYIHAVKWFAIIPVIFLPIIFVFAIHFSIAIWKNNFISSNGKEATKITETLFDQSFILVITICLLIATILLPIAGIKAVRVVEDPTEPTSEPVTEASTETTETATKQVVEIDGQYYELVPIG